ncbi:MAG: SlyX family protein [Azoarcus sp.]|jgi:SlyX protein|nr:SlyX family protein [Azoarcus sp.]
MSGVDERLERLESRLMLAEDQIDALNGTIYRQQCLIERLQAQITQMAQWARQLQDARAPSPPRPEDELPPHW